VWKLKRCFKGPVHSKIFYQTRKLSSICFNNDPTPTYLRSHVFYKLTYLACNAEYIGKTDRCVRVRKGKHSSDHYSAMFQHLHSCKAFKVLLSLNNLTEYIKNKTNVVNFKSHVHQTILNNVTIIAYNNNYNQLWFLESLLIKRYKPQLNYSIKAAKELPTFLRLGKR